MFKENKLEQSKSLYEQAIAVSGCRSAPSKAMFLVQSYDSMSSGDEQWYHNDSIVFDNQDDFDAAYNF
jgi:hypothetical protein